MLHGEVGGERERRDHPEDRRVAAGLAANAVGVELMISLWARGVLSDDEALAVATAAVESLRRTSQAEPHPAWQAAQDLVWELATRFNGAKGGTLQS